MKKKIIFSIIGIFLSLAGVLTINNPQLVFAEEENIDTAPTTTEKLKERIEKIVEQRKDKIEKVLGESSLQKRGFVGQISRVSETTLTLDVFGTNRIVPFDETTELLKNNAEISAENIAVDGWVTVMGIWEDDSINPRKIIFSDKSPLPDQQLVELGSLKEINNRSVVFQSRYSKSETTIYTNSKTTVEDLEGIEADISQLSEEDQVLIVGYKDSDDDSYATTIRALAPFTKE
jgi:hypothetical protein